MAATVGTEMFETMLQQTHAWLKQIAERLGGGEDRRPAYAALRGTLHALRDRLTPEQAVHLGAQLPTLVRGIYYDGWRMSAAPRRDRHKADFLARVGEDYHDGTDEAELERAATAVFALLARELDPGQVGKTIAALPEEVRELWPAHMVEAAMAEVQAPLRG